TFNSWNGTALKASGSVVTTTITLDAGTYSFKVHDTSADVWYGNNGTIEDTTEATSTIGWEMKSSEGNCQLVATGGTYTFSFNPSTKYLIITKGTPATVAPTTVAPTQGGSTEATLYYVPTQDNVNAGYSYRVNLQTSSGSWKQYVFAKTDKTYNGVPVYKTVISADYDTINLIQYQVYKESTFSTWVSQVAKEQVTALATYDNTMLVASTQELMAPVFDGETEPTQSGDVDYSKYSLVGYINGADAGSGSDYENVPNVFSADGTQTLTITETSYVYVKTTDNANWYMFEELCEDTTGTLKNTLTGTSEKMKVPAGEITFTLVKNADGTLSLSYATEEPTEAPTTVAPTEEPTEAPTTVAPTEEPTEAPTTVAPTEEPTEAPTTEAPTEEPTEAPTTEAPTEEPTEAPTTETPTEEPTEAPTESVASTFYYVPTQADINAGYSFKLYVRVVDENGKASVKSYVMTETDKTYNGVAIYSYTFDNATSINNLKVQTYDGGTWKSQLDVATSTTSEAMNNKMLVKATKKVIDYTYDTEQPTEAPTEAPTEVKTSTFYYVPTQADINAGYSFKLYVRVVDENGKASVKSYVMTETDKTYNGVAIYSYTFDNATSIDNLKVQTYSGTAWKSQMDVATSTTSEAMNNKMLVKATKTVIDYTYDTEQPTEAPTEAPTEVKTSTFYYVPTQADVNAGYSYKLYVRVVDENGKVTSTKSYVMTQTDKTYNGLPIYSYTFDNATSIDNLKVQTYSGTAWKSQLDVATSTTSEAMNNKMLVKATKTVIDYTYDAEQPTEAPTEEPTVEPTEPVTSTFYYVPTQADVDAGYSYRLYVRVVDENGTPISAKSYVMTNTDKTYNGLPIYSYTFDNAVSISNLRVQTYDGGTWKSQLDVATSTTSEAMNNKMYVKTTKTIVDYSCDVE
ncbi:MAG: PT domain-containing protein, partial [Ruminococcus sp.]